MQTYNDFTKYLDNLGEGKINPGLERTFHACKLLGHPEHKFNSIHIAGTNGKGSVAAYLEAILRNNGFKTGLYTSPHLVDVLERIQINRCIISPEKAVELGNEIKQKCEGIGLSYFEFLTLLSFLFFATESVDIAVLETGLGGRFDATNVVTPVLSVITQISIDHTSFLGEDILSIAKEKLGIVKPGVPLVLADQSEDIIALAKKRCEEQGSALVVCRDLEEKINYKDYQQSNAQTAICAAKQLSDYDITNYNIEDVHWPGRFQTISTDPLIVLDGAHNEGSCRFLANYLKSKYKDNNIVVIFGAMRDKDLVGMVSALKDVAASWVLLPLNGSRAAKVEEMKAVIGTENILVASDVCAAIDLAVSQRLKNQLILVTGSLYLVGDFVKAWGEVDSD